MAARNDPQAPASGFNEEQRSELAQMIADAVASAKPPASPPSPADPPSGPKAISDDDWDRMTDRQRESWVRSLVDFRLDQIVQADATIKDRERLARLEEAAKPKVEAERPPDFLSKLRSFLWGRDPEER